MAIRLEFHNNVYRVDDVIKKYPGGYKAFKEHWRLCIRLWYDGVLIRFGDMCWPCGGELGPDIPECVIDAGFDFETPPDWHTDGRIIWTDRMPDEPMLIEDGSYYQGGFFYKTHDAWAIANMRLVEYNNPKTFYYFEGKGLIEAGWYNDERKRSL